MGEKPQGKTQKTAAYNQSYYARNAERIKERKRKRWLNDPEYREKQEQRQRELRAEAVAKRKKTRKLRSKEKNYKVVLSDGHEVTVRMMTISQLAANVGMAAITLRKWEKLGVLPPTQFQTASGHRLYTEHQSSSLSDVVSKFRKPTGWRLTEEFAQAIHASWMALDNGVDRASFKLPALPQ